MISLVNFFAGLVVIALLPPATARLTRLVTRDSIAEPLRSWVRKKYGEHSMRAELISCHWCVGMWVSVLTNAWGWTLLAYSHVYSPVICVLVGLLSIPAVAYVASRMIDREDG